MSQSGATVSQDCITAFNDLKLAKKYKFIIFKLSDDNREIVVEEASGDKDWEVFREKLVNATTKSRGGSVGKGPRYAVYDFEYNLASGEGSRNKITFIAWSPDDAGVMVSIPRRNPVSSPIFFMLTPTQGQDGVCLLQGGSEALVQWHCYRVAGQRPG
ncbi:cofilin/tropomyosin-type actin-binding protein [Biscogniauxia mediterranea]|nr:cofilin/tropomyosin-type actin-binding protein [Biscogniauxia mediterranea]